MTGGFRWDWNKALAYTAFIALTLALRSLAGFWAAVHWWPVGGPGERIRQGRATLAFYRQVEDWVSDAPFNVATPGLGVLLAVAFAPRNLFHFASQSGVAGWMLIVPVAVLQGYTYTWICMQRLDIHGQGLWLASGPIWKKIAGVVLAVGWVLVNFSLAATPASVGP